MKDIVLAALIKKRAVMAGEIEQARATIAKLSAALEHIDATIHQFDAGYEIATIRPLRLRAPGQRAERGHVTRKILSMLRENAAPMTLRDITLRLMEARGMDVSDRETVALMIRRTRVILSKQRRNHILHSTTGANKATHWAVT